MIEDELDRCVLWAEQFSDDDSLMNSEDIVQIFYSQRQMKDKELKEAHIESLNRSVAHNEELRRKAIEEEQTRANDIGGHDCAETRSASETCFEDRKR